MFTYDNNGNMTTGDGLLIHYNEDNKPTQITRNSITSTFNYGADGMRYKQTTTVLDKTYLNNHTVLFTPVQGNFMLVL